jgi:hypothetical protein
MDDIPAQFGLALGAPTDETSVHPARDRANTKRCRSKLGTSQRSKRGSPSCEQIDLLRGNGNNDDEIAALIGRAVDVTITADEIAGPQMPLPTAATANWPSIIASRGQG